MAMGIVNNEAFDAELASFNKPIETNIVDIKRGRHGNEVPSALRKVIAEEAITGKTNKELAETFGLAHSTIGAYRVGATSPNTFHKKDEDLNAHVIKVKQGIADSARGKILEALDHITSEKMSKAKLRDVSSVARDMASVMEKMDGNNNERTNIQQLVIFAPRMKQEDDYEIIDVSASA